MVQLTCLSSTVSAPADDASGSSPPPHALADKRYPWIDVLRGIAILMVIAVHASHGLKNSESLIKAVFGFGGYFDGVRDVGSRLLSKKIEQERAIRANPLLTRIDFLKKVFGTVVK